MDNYKETNDYKELFEIVNKFNNLINNFSSNKNVFETKEKDFIEEKIKTLKEEKEISIDDFFQKINPVYPQKNLYEKENAFLQKNAKKAVEKQMQNVLKNKSFVQSPLEKFITPKILDSKKINNLLMLNPNTNIINVLDVGNTEALKNFVEKNIINKDFSEMVNSFNFFIEQNKDKLKISEAFEKMQTLSAKATKKLLNNTSKLINNNSNIILNFIEKFKNEFKNFIVQQAKQQTEASAKKISKLKLIEQKKIYENLINFYSSNIQKFKLKILEDNTFLYLNENNFFKSNFPFLMEDEVFLANILKQNQQGQNNQENQNNQQNNQEVQNTQNDDVDKIFNNFSSFFLEQANKLNNMVSQNNEKNSKDFCKQILLTPFNEAFTKFKNDIKNYLTANNIPTNENFLNLFNLFETNIKKAYNSFLGLVFIYKNFYNLFYTFENGNNNLYVLFAYLTLCVFALLSKNIKLLNQGNIAQELVALTQVKNDYETDFYNFFNSFMKTEIGKGKGKGKLNAKLNI